MNLWQRFLDRIFDSPFGKMTPADKAAAEARGAAVEQQFLDNIDAAQAEEQRKARRGKHWEYVGDRLHLDGFPITIRRATADEVQRRGGIFCVECDSLMPNFAWTLEDAQFVGERWAKEIDALPLAQKEGPAEGGGKDFKPGVARFVSIVGIGMVLIYGRDLDRLSQAGMTPEEAINRRMATAEKFTFKFKDDAVLPGENSDE